MTILKSFTPGFVADGGSAPGDVCDTLNQGLRRGNVLWAQTGARRPVEVFCIGDSLAQQMGTLSDRSALFWAMSLYNLAVTFKSRGGRGVGTSVSGPARSDGNAAFGMTSDQRMAGDATAIAASVADGFAPVAIMSIQTNDFYAGDNGQSGAMSSVANVEKWLLAMLPYGLAHLVINSGGPFAADATVRTRGIVLAYRALAEKYRGLVTLVDNSTLLAANAQTYAGFGGQFVYGGIYYDPPSANGGNQGLHPSGYGAYLMGKWTLGPALLKLVGERVRLVGWVGDAFDATLNSRGALMRGSARYGGSNVDTTFNPSGTLTVTQSDVLSPIDAAIGRPDILARQFTFSGTPTAAWSLSFGRASNEGDYDPRVTPFMPEANLYIDLMNVKAPKYDWVGGSVGGGSPNDCDVIPRLEGQMTMTAGAPMLADAKYGNRQASISISGIAGKEVSGKLTMISASDYPVPTLPTATA